MATGTEKKAINSWEWDVRVRERNVRKGVFDEKEIEKHLGALPDVGEQSEIVNYPQPALGGRED
ncbi:MAG TPA: hypothetical protein VH044_08740 [Polyangiaceae bacterium]|jgi:hypothetical protein|nr:hypothetical protein [Polyangiaceae bacterium]